VLGLVAEQCKGCRELGLIPSIMIVLQNIYFNYYMNWTTDQETILSAIQKNSFDISIAKRARFKSLKSILHFFKIPIIVLSGLNSVFSVGLNPYIEQKTISILTCSLSLFVSIIGSVELYLSINSQMNNELELSKQFYLLSIDIYKELHLSKENRSIDGKTFLLDKFSIYQKLIEQSGMLSKSINDCLKPLPLEDSLKIIATNDLSSNSSNGSNEFIL
jgi:hypothetical protein